MKLLKPAISTLLLMSYLWGFGHSLIPHCQEDCAAFNSPKKIHHHDHETDDEADAKGDKNYIHHNNHLDNNWIDFYICLLSEYEHHGENNHPLKTDQDNDIRILNFDFTSDIKLIDNIKHEEHEFFDIEQFQNSSTNSINAPPLNRYLYLFMQNISLRGPPVHSC